MKKHFDLSLSLQPAKHLPFELYQVFAIFVVPIALIYFGVIPAEWRLVVLLMGALMIYGIIRKEKWSLRMLGVTRFHTEKAFIPYLIFTVTGVFFIIGLASVWHHTPQFEAGNMLHLLFLFLPISALQEFAYRGYLMPVLYHIYRSPVRIIFINTILFAFLHVIYPEAQVNLPLAFIGGLGFSMMYYRYPNLILISLTHAILNFTAVLYGFFTLPNVL